MSPCGCNVEDLVNKASIRLEWGRCLNWERVTVGQNGRGFKKRLGYETFLQTQHWGKKYLENNCFYFLSKKSHIPTYYLTSTSKFLTASKTRVLTQPTPIHCSILLYQFSYLYSTYNLHLYHPIILSLFQGIIKTYQLGDNTTIFKTPDPGLTSFYRNLHHQTFQEHKTSNSQNTENKLEQ